MVVVSLSVSDSESEVKRKVRQLGSYRLKVPTYLLFTYPTTVPSVPYLTRRYLRYLRYLKYCRSR